MEMLSVHSENHLLYWIPCHCYSDICCLSGQRSGCMVKWVLDDCTPVLELHFLAWVTFRYSSFFCAFFPEPAGYSDISEILSASCKLGGNVRII